MNLEGCEELLEAVKSMKWSEPLATLLETLLIKDQQTLEANKTKFWSHTELLLDMSEDEFTSKFPEDKRDIAHDLFIGWIADDNHRVLLNPESRLMEQYNGDGVLKLNKFVLADGLDKRHYSRRWTWEELLEYPNEYFHNVKELHMQESGMTFKDCGNLSKFLDKFPSLIKLDLSDNYLSPSIYESHEIPEELLRFYQQSNQRKIIVII